MDLFWNLFLFSAKNELKMDIAYFEQEQFLLMLLELLIFLEVPVSNTPVGHMNMTSKHI